LARADDVPRKLRIPKRSGVGGQPGGGETDRGRDLRPPPHTVAYRLERVKELSGLDPMQTEDRERLGLGLKAYRIIAPGLPR
jgi:hypothetical protein